MRRFAVVLFASVIIAASLVASCGSPKKPTAPPADQYALMYGSWSGVVEQWCHNLCQDGNGNPCDYCWTELDSVKLAVTPGKPYPTIQLSVRELGGSDLWTSVPIQVTGTWDSVVGPSPGRVPDWTAAIRAECGATTMPASHWYGGYDSVRGALFFDVVWPGEPDSLGVVLTAP